MSVADKLGTFPWLGWLVDFNSFWLTLLVAWQITPGMMMLIAPIFESRWLPLDPSRQFLSFFPGDLFLGLAFAFGVKLAAKLPDKQRWYNAPLWHWLVLVGAFVAASIMTFVIERGAYELDQLYSPTKLYHNYVLYVFYGYVILTTLLPALLYAPWDDAEANLLRVGVLAPLLIWANFVRLDNGPGAEGKAQHAHIHGWDPIWAPVKRI